MLAAELVGCVRAQPTFPLVTSPTAHLPALARPKPLPALEPRLGPLTANAAALRATLATATATRGRSGDEAVLISVDTATRLAELLDTGWPEAIRLIRDLDRLARAQNEQAGRLVDRTLAAEELADLYKGLYLGLKSEVGAQSRLQAPEIWGLAGMAGVLVGGFAGAHLKQCVEAGR